MPFYLGRKYLEICVFLSVSCLCVALELRLESGLEWRSFLKSGDSYSDVSHTQMSYFLSPEIILGSDPRTGIWTVKPFFRMDSHDEARTYADLKEFSYAALFERFDLLLGVGKVFWGVTESVHLVDIINQTDLRENADAEDKLGQPMIKLGVPMGSGEISIFVLPYFREREFVSQEGRLRPPYPIRAKNRKFESNDEETHVDAAFRLTQTFGDLDLALSYFDGTARDPQFIALADDRGLSLVPFYPQVQRWGAELQYIYKDWLWKFEGVFDVTHESTYAWAGGFEYTFVGVAGSMMDIGVLMEYMDGSDEYERTTFKEHLFTGSRVVVNDMYDSEVLLGMISNTHGKGHMVFIEASRRLGQSWVIGIEFRGFQNVDNYQSIYFMEDEDFFQTTLSYFY